jgi:hypothetical protein
VPWIALYYIQRGERLRRRVWVHHTLRILDLPPHGQDVIGKGGVGGTRCVTVAVNPNELDALVVRGYLGEEERNDGAAIKRRLRGMFSCRAPPIWRLIGRSDETRHSNSTLRVTAAIAAAVSAGRAS